MGIDPHSLNSKQLSLMSKADRKPLGKLGLTKEEALHKETTTLERNIHDQFSGFCNRHGVDVWHSNPVRKSTIEEGLPDFLCWKNGIAIAIEFKVWPNKLSKVQEQKITRLLSHKNPTYVCEENAPGAAYRAAIQLLTNYFDLEFVTETL